MSIKSSKWLSFWKVLKLIFWCFLLMLLLSFAGFYIFKDKISGRILAYSGEYLNAELNFSDIAFSPFVHFPEASLIIKNLSLCNDSLHPVSQSDTLIAIDRLYISLNVKALWHKELAIARIKLDGGKIFAESYADSTNNLALAFLQSDTLPATADTLTGEEETYLPFIKLKSVELTGLQVHYTDALYDTDIALDVRDVVASFQMDKDSILSFLDADILVKKLPLSSKIVFRNQQLQLNGVYKYAFGDNKMLLEHGQLKLNKSQLNADGYFVLDEVPRVNVRFSASNKGLELLSFFLGSDIVPEIYAGDAYLNGSVIGTMGKTLPQIKCNFGFQNLGFLIPNTQDSIQELTFKGHMYSGTRMDLSAAEVKVDTLTAILPDGWVNGKFFYRDFVHPFIQYKLDLSTRLSFLNGMLPPDVVQQVDGHIRCTAQLEGNPQDSSFLAERKAVNTIQFDQIKARIPGYVEQFELNGDLSGNLDTICVNNVALLLDNSDFQVNGQVFDLSHFFFTKAEPFYANLQITSNRLDVLALSGYDEDIGEYFPYQITNAALSGRAILSYQNLMERYPMPELDVQIKECTATLEDLLPPLWLKGGTFRMLNQDEGMKVVLDDVTLGAEGTEMLANFTYLEEPFIADHFFFDAQIKKLDLAQFTTLPDTGFVRKGASLHGDLTGYMSVPADTSSLFESLEIKMQQMTLQMGDTAMEVSGLAFTGNAVDYSSQSENPLESLQGNYVFKIDSINSPFFSLDGHAYKINARQGAYTISSLYNELFGYTGVGYMRIEPFSKPRKFAIDYEVPDFPIVKFITEFKLDSMITGQARFHLSLNTQGDSIAEMLSRLNGEISLTAHDVTYYGIDVDQLIRQLEKSQQFTLVDLGGVLLAGPVGLAFTKGSNYTRLALTDRTAETRINEISSDWVVQDGICRTRDVALSTTKYRVAAFGNTNLATDEINFLVAVLNKKGCEDLKQKVSGTWQKPKLGKLTVVTSLLAPVTNLVDDATTFKCDPIYVGRVKHPEKEKFSLKKEKTNSKPKRKNEDEQAADSVDIN